MSNTIGNTTKIYSGALLGTVILAGTAATGANGLRSEAVAPGVAVSFSDASTARKIPVTSWAGRGYRTLYRTAVNVRAGDILDITGRGHISNRVGYNVGIGWHLWAYDIDGDSSRWWRVGTPNTDNVDMKRHHMPLHVDTVYRVPAWWPEGHRMMVVLRADAFSTRHRKSRKKIKVDPYGGLTVRRYRAGSAS